MDSPAPVHSSSVDISESEIMAKVDLETEQSFDETNIEIPVGSWFSADSDKQNLIPAKATVARDWLNKRREGLRPWRSFLKTDKFHLPSGVASATRRLVTNVEFFQSNYLCVFIVLFIYCILTSPLLLVALGACFGLVYLIRARDQQHKLRMLGREFPPAYQYAGVAALSFPLFYFAGAGSIIFWVIGASIFVIVAHALLYASEEVPGAEFQMENV